MGKHFRGTFSLVASLLLLCQLVFPMTSVSAATATSTLNPHAVTSAATGTLLPPSNLASALTTPSDVKLTWSSVYGASGYNVYQISDGSMQLLGSTTSTSYTINNLAQGSYQYVVSTLSSGSESGPCAPVDVTITYPTMAAPATLTNTIANGNDIVLTWAASQYAQTYNVYSIAADGSQTLVTSTANKTYTITNSPAGASTYAVTAVNSLYGESPLSTPLNVNITYPTMAAPANLKQTIANGNDITLSWSAVSYATGYNVYSVAADGTKTLLGTVTGTSVTYTNQPAGTYTYEVHSTSTRFGESATGSTVSVTLAPVTMAAPANLTDSIGTGNNVTLSWSSVPYATSYNIYQVVNGQNTLVTSATSTSTVLKGLAAGDYTYEVTSNSTRFGESTGSQVSFSVTSIAMTAPTNLKYTLSNGNNVTLAWSAVQYATSYNVYQVVNGQNTLVTTVTGTSASLTNLANGDYTYEVHSNSTTYGESADGSQVSFSIGATQMTAPDNFAYTIQNGNDIALTWDAVSGATSYKVYQIVNGQAVLKGTYTGTSATYTNMAAGDYTYEVHSYSSTYGESPAGASQVSLTVVFPTMAPPQNVVQAVKDATDFSLSWDAAPYATSYKVYQIVNGTQTLKQTVSTTSASFSNVTPGDYTYMVTAVSSRFGESASGTQVTFTMNGQTMLPPTNLTYSAANINDITLKWTAAQYATSYKIYQVVNGQPVLKSTVTGTSVTYTNLPGGDYDYIVDSVSSTLGESPTGAEVTFTLTLPTMADPTNLAYTIQSGNNVVLTWTAAQYATSYKVYELVNGTENLITTVTGVTATISNVASGDHVYVVHSSSTRFGDSDGSQIDVSVNAVNMQAPANLTQSVANGNDIVLSWSAATYATSYKVYQVVNGQLVLKSTVAGTSVTYTNQPAGDYTYEVHSYNANFGESPAGNSQISFTLVWPTMQPPTNLTQSVANGNDITLKWTASQYATSYNIYQITNGQKVLKGTATGTSVTYTNQPAGDYTFEVHAVSTRFGESPDGSTTAFTLVWPTVQPPTLKGTIANANNLTLTWNTVTWANEYHVYEVAADGTMTLLYKGTALTTTLYNLTQATHNYEVTAYSTRFGESAPSNVLNEQIIYPVMQPPVATAKVLTSNSAQLSWTFATYANGYNIYEIVNGQPVSVAKNVNNLSYTLSNLSYANHQYYVTSYSNSFGESAPSNTVVAQLIVDTTPPVTTATAPTTWTNKSATVAFSATDDITGVANTYYSVNGNPFVAGTSVTITQEGDNKVSYYSVDKVGNTEATKTIDVLIDQTAPVTQASSVPAWSNGPQTITLTATDALSGVAATYYSINGATPVAGNTITIDADSTNTVTYYSVDNAGNQEQPQTITVNVDKTAPVTTATAPTDWSNQDATVTFSATDAQSGVANTYYSVDGSDYAAGTSVTISTEGDHQVTYYSVDKAGNEEQAQTIEVKIDKTAPTTTSDAQAAWANQDVTVNLSATDALSGVANTYYSIDGSDYATGTSFTVSGEGTHKVTFYSVDNVGNQEQPQTVTVNIDKTAPVTTATAPTDWSNQDATVSLSATDALSGVANTYYSVDGSDYATGTTVTISTEGDHKVTYYSVDNAGNQEQAQTIEVKIDKTAPTTTSDASTAWMNKDVTVNLNATDALSGVANTYYSIDGSDYVTGTSFTVSEEGTHKVTFYSVDNVGNQEQPQSITINIDKTAPVTTATAPSGWSNQDATISLSATDDLSGVANTYYSVDGSDYATGTTLTISTEGDHKVTYYSVDNAGNQEQAQTIEVKIDKTAPVTTSNAPSGWTNQNVTVNLSATDALSGVANTYYSVDGSAYATGTSFTISTEGVHTITYYSVDNAGNTEATETATVQIEKSAPTISINIPSEIPMGTKQAFSYTATNSLTDVTNQQMIVTGPSNNPLNILNPALKKGEVVANGGIVNLMLPGNYTVTVTATDAAGNTTTITKQFVVYIPINLTVTAKMIKPNQGEFTVRVTLPNGYSTNLFDLNSVTLDGVKALNDNNGYYQQASNGQFKFDRDDFTWTSSAMTVTFRGYVDGFLVIGTATVNVQKS